MTYELSPRSLARLEGVHPDLVRVVRGAILHSAVDFTVIEGLRTLERQRELFAAAKTRTMRSRHLDGHAVDLAPIIDEAVSWDRSHFYPICDAMRASAAACGVPIEWGGDWQTFVDMPHWQLPWSKYP